MDKQPVRQNTVNTRTPEKYLLVDTETMDVWRGIVRPGDHEHSFTWTRADADAYSTLLKVSIDHVVRDGLAEAEAAGEIEADENGQWHMTDKIIGPVKDIDG